MEVICSSETSVAFNGLRSVISQKIILFITTAVRTSDPVRLDRTFNTLTTEGGFVRKIIRSFF
jgi:hypothetical protein